MTARLSLLRRHPIKGIGGESLEQVHLLASRPLPGDRQWALLHEGGEHHAAVDPARWLPKSCFLQGARSAALQAVQGGWSDEAGDVLTLTHPGLPDLTFAPATEGAALAEWVAPLWPAGLPAATRLVRATTAWMDVSQPWVSILSISSLSALEAQLGRALGTSRWRGNIWVEGWEPGHELDLIGQILKIGQVELLVKEPIGRCAATSADTQTGTIDGDMPATLQAIHAHKNFGIYAQVVTGGRVRIGDEVQL